MMSGTLPFLTIERASMAPVVQCGCRCVLVREYIVRPLMVNDALRRSDPKLYTGCERRCVLITSHAWLLYPTAWLSAR